MFVTFREFIQFFYLEHHLRFQQPNFNAFRFHYKCKITSKTDLLLRSIHFKDRFTFKTDTLLNVW